MSQNLSLFDTPALLESLPIIDGELAFCQNFYAAPSAEELMEKLLRETAWRQEQIHVWGKAHAQPRLVAWHGDPGTAYGYSGITLQASDWSPTLRQIKNEIESATGHSFNSVLLNLYRDQHDHVGWHSDDEPELGTNPVIASLSLGATRIFKLKHKTKSEQKVLSFELSSGSLLMMAGGTQHHWKHCIAKQSRASTARINLTFRQLARINS